MPSSGQELLGAVTFRRRSPPSLANILRHRPTPARSPFGIPKIIENGCTEASNNILSDPTCPVCCIISFSSNDKDMHLNTVGCVMCANSLHEIEESTAPSDFQQGKDLIENGKGVSSMQRGAFSVEVQSSATTCNYSLLGLDCCAALTSNAGPRTLSDNSNTTYVDKVGCMLDVRHVQRRRRKALVPGLYQ